MKAIRIFIFFPVLLLWACSKDDGGCFTSYGDTTSEMRFFDPFDAIYLEGRIDVEYRFDSVYRAEVVFGDKLIDQIKTDQWGSILYVSNDVRCNGLRDPGKVPIITIHAPRFNYMENKLAGDLTFRDTLRTSVFKYEQWQSNGEIALLLDTDTTRVFAHVGYTHISVVGRTDVAELYTGSSGPLDALHLIARIVMSNNSSVQDLTLYADEYLYGFIGRSGNIRYAGDPEVVETNLIGTGVVEPL